MAQKTEPKAPHGRPLFKAKKGSDVVECQQCRFLESPDPKHKATPANMPCRLAFACQNKTPACVKFTPAGVSLAAKEKAALFKASGGRPGHLGKKTPGSCLSTGVYTLDLVTGGGWAAGGIGIVFGPPESGKTTLLVKTLGASARRRIPVEIYDAEGSHDADWMENSGLPLVTEDGESSLDPAVGEHVEFDSGEEMYSHIARKAKAIVEQHGRCESGPPRAVFVCDSIAAVTPELEYETDGDKRQRAAQASMNADGLRLTKALVKKSRMLVLMTNHTGTIPGQTYGSPEYEKGGDALKFYSTMRLRAAARASGMPQPAATARGQREEKSWRGKGKDRFVYTQIRVVRNRGFTVTKGETDCWVRICTSEADGPGTGIDLAYDIFQYLVATGQAEWAGRERVALSIREIKVIAGKKGEPYTIQSRPLPGLSKDKSMTWLDFRKLVMEHGKGKIAGPDLEELVQTQIGTGWAIKRYFEEQGE